MHEGIEDFYRHKLGWVPDGLGQEVGHFNVFRLDDFVGENAKPVPYSRRDFFKISYIRGRSRIHYADRTVETPERVLLFANPHVPYTWESLDDELTGYFCVFTEAFFHRFGNLLEYAMFRPGGEPIYVIPTEQAGAIGAVYERMVAELATDYRHKYDVLRALALELIHTALKLQPTPVLEGKQPDSAERVTGHFLELLERQFPIEDPRQRIGLRTPNDFAAQLAIHVNYLNRSLKKITDKTTSTIIGERIGREARILLKHSDWNVADIAYSLGFREAAHFSNFFRKHYGDTPRAYRKV